jgi:hypothetical protein
VVSVALIARCVGSRLPICANVASDNTNSQFHVTSTCILVVWEKGRGLGKLSNCSLDTDNSKAASDTDCKADGECANTLRSGA